MVIIFLRKPDSNNSTSNVVVVLVVVLVVVFLIMVVRSSLFLFSNIEYIVVANDFVQTARPTYLPTDWFRVFQKGHGLLTTHDFLSI